jgi:hypothetical protein
LINTWLARHPRFHAHFTPTSPSWIHQAEQWFAKLSTTYIRRGTHRSARQLEEAFRRYIQINKLVMLVREGRDNRNISLLRSNHA